MAVVSSRLPPDLVRRLDQFTAKLRQERPGLTATRGDAVRMLLLEGLDRAERKESVQ